MDASKEDETDIAARAKAEKYAKILAKTIVNPEGGDHGQNAFFYDAAEGLLTSVIRKLIPLAQAYSIFGYRKNAVLPTPEGRSGSWRKAGWNWQCPVPRCLSSMRRTF